MNDNELKILVFSINDELYATDIMEVERILGYEELTKLPDSPKFLEGVMNYEGNILPVISLNKRFNLPENNERQETKIIVAREGTTKIGIIVDVVTEVKDVSLKDIENPPEITLSIAKRYIKGLIKKDKNIIIFLNLSMVLSEEEKSMLV